MSKNAFILVIIFLLVATGFLGWFFLFRSAVPEGGIDLGDPSGSELFPFGESRVPIAGTGGSETSETSSGSEETEKEAPIERLRRLSIEPQAGAAFIRSTSTIAVRYVEKATGHIYEAEIDAAAQKKISNITIPKVAEALWSGDGSRLLYRYLSSDSLLKTFYAKIATTTRPEQALEGLYLPNGIREIEVQGSKILYVSASDAGSQITQANIDGSEKTTVYASSYSDWALSWQKPETATIYTKPSGLVDGQGFNLDIRRGTITKFADDSVGLIANQSPKGTRILMSKGGVPSIYSYDTASKTTTAIALETFADKCAWNPNSDVVIYCAVPYTIGSGIYPDDWYKGAVSFSDRIWKIDTATGDTEIILEPRDSQAMEFDIVDMQIDRDGSHLLFTNKIDSSLWLYDLK